MLKSSNRKMVNPDDNAQYIGVISLPALVTCRDNPPCKDFCYALGYPMLFHSQPDGAYSNNLREYLRNSQQFFDNLKSELFFTPFRWVRWFDSGDIPDKRFLEGMCEVATAYPEIRFMAFTKKFELVNDYLADNSLPDNLIIGFSNCGYWRVQNPYNLPETEIRFGDERDLVIGDVNIECSGNCAQCCVKVYEGTIPRNCFYAKSGDKIAFHLHGRKAKKITLDTEINQCYNVLKHIGTVLNQITERRKNYV